MPEFEAIRLQLARILASTEFVNAERMRRFLRLIVTEAIEGRSSRLKEYAIGVEVFDRPISFDPGADPIVRVEARRLRSKLEHYYESKGRQDSIVIELPKGRYAPVFRRRDEGALGVAAQVPNTIAVLPFQNLSVSPDGQFFSDGLTWELIHQLTRIEGISVVAWTSSSQVRESADVIAAGAKLKAGTVLTGSVRQAGDRLRIVAQLLSTSTGVYLWSETYDRRLEDIFAIQDDIAHAIVSRLEVGLGLARRPVRAATSYNLEAYQMYLHGRAHWNQRTLSGIQRSIEYFRRANAIDPLFALPHAGLADAHALLADYGYERPADVIPTAKSAALRALELDPSLAEAHSSLGLLSALYEWKWAEAEAHFRRALQLNPGYATAHHWLSTDLLALVGRLDEGFTEIDVAHQLDPLSPIIHEGRGYLYMLARRYEESAAHHRLMRAAHPNFYKSYTSLGRTLLQMGLYREAIEHLQKAREMGGELPSILGAMGQAYGLEGNSAEATRILNRLNEMSRGRYVPSTCFALVHLGLGERERALEWLELGIDQREFPLTSVGTHPAYDSLRQEPRFRMILERLGLAFLP